MYLPQIYFSPDDFPTKPHSRGTGLSGFDLRGSNPATFTPAGFLSENDFNSFMEMADGFGLSPHHISRRWAVHIPARTDCHCVVFYYDGRFGAGFALAFRNADGFCDLHYLLF